VLHVTMPSDQCEIFIGLLSGAANRERGDAMAYADRDVKFVMNVHGRWHAPDQDAACIGWARRFFEAAAPFASGGAYVNFMTAEETGRVAAAYGQNYSRLAEIKRRYDPNNIFHVNRCQPEHQAVMAAAED
jgi:FAD/FMN-containing dehydrogenase